MKSDKLLKFLLTLFLVLTLAACLHDDDAASEDVSEPADAVATVNGEVISESDVDAQYQAMIARGQSVTRDQALDELIELVLLKQEAENQLMHEQVDIRAELRRQRMGTLANHLLRAELNAFEADDNAIEAAYERRYGEGASREEYHARHILVETREQAEAMIAALEEDGDFAELAREHSIGPSGPRGGDLEWFRAEEVVQPFGDAVQALAVGDWSRTPVETRFGWHVILLEDVRAIDPPALDEVRGELENELLGEFIESYISSLRDDGDIDIR